MWPFLLVTLTRVNQEISEDYAFWFGLISCQNAWVSYGIGLIKFLCVSMHEFSCGNTKFNSCNSVFYHITIDLSWLSIWKAMWIIALCWAMSRTPVCQVFYNKIMRQLYGEFIIRSAFSVSPSVQSVSHLSLDCQVYTGLSLSLNIYNITWRVSGAPLKWLTLWLSSQIVGPSCIFDIGINIIAWLMCIIGGL